MKTLVVEGNRVEINANEIFEEEHNSDEQFEEIPEELKKQESTEEWLTQDIEDDQEELEVEKIESEGQKEEVVSDQLQEIEDKPIKSINEPSILLPPCIKKGPSTKGNFQKLLSNVLNDILKLIYLFLTILWL